MIPSILEGDRIVVDKLAYDLRVPFTLVRVARWADPKRSDVVTFESPEDGRLLVKRVVGVPGDIVQLLNTRLIVNGEEAAYMPIPASRLPAPASHLPASLQVADENVLGESRMVMRHVRPHPQVVTNFGPIEVPQDQYLMLGDNRDNSQDFRIIGFVNRDLILGKANAIAFSLDYENFYTPRGDRFFRELE